MRQRRLDQQRIRLRQHRATATTEPAPSEQPAHTERSEHCHEPRDIERADHQPGEDQPRPGVHDATSPNRTGSRVGDQSPCS